MVVNGKWYIFGLFPGFEDESSVLFKRESLVASAVCFLLIGLVKELLIKVLVIVFHLSF